MVNKKEIKDLLEIIIFQDLLDLLFHSFVWTFLDYQVLFIYIGL